MVLLVCGDRHWEDTDFLFETLDRLNTADDSIDVLIEGEEANGADSLARRWAQARGVKLRAFPAQWQDFGPRARPIRNLQMLNEGQPNRVVAFHDHIIGSKGTVHMLNLAAAAMVPCTLYSHKSPGGRQWPLRS